MSLDVLKTQLPATILQVWELFPPIILRWILITLWAKTLSRREFYLVWKAVLLLFDWALEQIFQAAGLLRRTLSSLDHLTKFLGSRCRAVDFCQLVTILVPLVRPIFDNEIHSHASAQLYLSVHTNHLQRNGHKICYTSTHLPLSDLMDQSSFCYSAPNKSANDSPRGFFQKFLVAELLRGAVGKFWERTS